MPSYAAGKGEYREADSMLAPLLSDDESSVDSDESSCYSLDKSPEIETAMRTSMQKLRTIVVYAGLFTGFAASAAAMALVMSIAIFIMGGLCIINAPYAVFKERKIGTLHSLRAMNNKLKEDANELEAQGCALCETIDDLKPEADRTMVVEEELMGMAERFDINANKLVDLVKENEVIVAQMRDNLRQRIVGDIITIVAKNNDHTFDMTEAKMLALRIYLALQVYGVEFDSDKFLMVIEKDVSLHGVIGILKKLSQNDGSDWDDDLDNIYDMFYMKEESGWVSIMKCDKKITIRTG